MNVFLSGLLPALAASGIETDVLTRGTKSVVAVSRPVPGVRVLHLPCGWEEEPPTREGALRALPRFISAARTLVGDRLDEYGAVSAHYWMSGIAARAVCGARSGRLSALPLAFMFHTIEERKHRVPGTVPDAHACIRMASERALAASVDAMVCLSAFDLAETVRWRLEASPRGVVIPPGVDDRFRHPPAREAARRRLGIDPACFLFLVAARPDAAKNTEEAVTAIRRLRASGRRDVTGVVAGQRAPAGDAGGGGVAYAGPVRYDAMPDYYAAADAVVCPSPYESFGLVPLEAIASGTPIVAPRTVYWGRRVGSEGGGLAYDPADPGGIDAALAAIASDDALRVRLAAECARLAAPFTWSRCAASWVALLSRLSRRDGRPGTPRSPGGRRRP
ncbi:MAG TPA: glycosyltransferase [Candidatus Deferrimicrobiaceae bacterium]|jgi:D-inositol-3-phosphate glycosyltransferase